MAPKRSSSTGGSSGLGRERQPGVASGWPWLLVLGICLLGLLPSWGTWGAPLIAEDTSILARVHEHGAAADWSGPQYGLHLVRFWRPVVSTSWWLQERLVGLDVRLLRTLNLALPIVVALALAYCVQRGRTGRVGALVGAATVLSFPFQGGTVTWLSGRTDSLVAAGMMLSVAACLARPSAVRVLLTFLLAFLACASKEFGFLLPLWVAGFWLAFPHGMSARSAVAVIAATSVAFAWRWSALGTFVGGYPVEWSMLARAGPGALGTLMAADLGLWLGVALAGILAARAGSLFPRLYGVGWFLGLLSLAPLLGLTLDGVLEPQNERLLFVSEVGLALSVAACLSKRGQRPLAFGALTLVVGAGLGWRFVRAYEDTHAWAASAHVASDWTQRARQKIAGQAPSTRPVLMAGFPRTYGPAYCLSFGVPERFRSPFEATARPVWPLRPLFPGDDTPSEPAFRAGVARRSDGTLWPWSDSPAVARLAVRTGDADAAGPLRVDERVLVSEDDRSPALQLAWPPDDLPGGGGELLLEAVIYTEQGYARAPWPSPRGSGVDPAELRLSLMGLMGLVGTSANLGSALGFAADLGARSAWVEIRAWSPAGELRAASPWIELVWEDAVVPRLLE